MHIHSLAVVLIAVGLIGLVQFAGVGLAARVLAGTGVSRLQRRLASPMVRHAGVLAAVSAAVCAAGLIVGTVAGPLAA